jgi:archaemetzincin
VVAIGLAALGSGDRAMSDGGGAPPAQAKPPTIAVVAFGTDVPRGLIEKLRPTLEARFGVQVVAAGPWPLPAEAYTAARSQHRSSRLLDELVRRRRPEWERIVGIASVDLYAPGLNFVFGEADEARRAAVFSIARLHGEGPTAGAVLERRALVEAIHELGHSYGLGHCSDVHCVMWFSNTLAETDRKTDRFCATHQAQLDQALHRLRGR